MKNDFKSVDAKEMALNVSRSLGNIIVVVSRRESNSSWSMGLGFKNIKTAKKFKRMVKKFAETENGNISF